MFDAHHDRLQNGRVRHDFIFHVNGADPFAAAFDDVFETVRYLEVAVFVDGADIAAAPVSVRSELCFRFRRVVVLTGNPGAADKNFAGLFCRRGRCHCPGRPPP